MYIVFFLAYALGVLAILGDLKTTMDGLAHGMRERNPVPRFLFPRIGQAFTGWLGGILYTGFALWAASKSFTAATVYCLGIAGIEIYFYLTNKALLKKLNIK